MRRENILTIDSFNIIIQPSTLHAVQQKSCKITSIKFKIRQTHILPIIYSEEIGKIRSDSDSYMSGTNDMISK